MGWELRRQLSEPCGVCADSMVDTSSNFRSRQTNGEGAAHVVVFSFSRCCLEFRNSSEVVVVRNSVPTPCPIAMKLR